MGLWGRFLLWRVPSLLHQGAHSTDTIVSLPSLVADQTSRAKQSHFNALLFFSWNALWCKVNIYIGNFSCSLRGNKWVRKIAHLMLLRIEHLKTSLAACAPDLSLSILICLHPCHINGTVNTCTADLVIMAQILWSIDILWSYCCINSGSSWVSGNSKLEKFHWNKLV